MGASHAKQVFGLLRLSISVLVLTAGCTRSSSHVPSDRLVLKYQPLGGDLNALHGVLREFEEAHPDIQVLTEPLPSSSDVLHQYFLTSLEGGTQDFDLLVVDVIWVAEFAQAGWIANLSPWFPPEEIRRDFLRGPAEAGIHRGETFAVPWYVDVGVLYYRTDLVPQAPTTYAELESFVLQALEKDKSLQGYLWQGKQYEGLLCNAYEAIWGHGGKSLQGDRVLLDTPEAQAGLAYLRRWISSGLSPASVTSATEEENRYAFQDGRAVFMRNWPYAYGEMQKPSSKVRGKFAVTTLPTLSGEPGAGTLGGYQLAINAHISDAKKALAADLIRRLTSERTNIEFALAYGRPPPRPAAYQSERLKEETPFLASLGAPLESAQPRPVTPFYTLFSDVLQGEFSAAISGIRSPENALKRAQKRVDYLMGLSSQ